VQVDDVVGIDGTGEVKGLEDVNDSVGDAGLLVEGETAAGLVIDGVEVGVGTLAGLDLNEAGRGRIGDSGNCNVNALDNPLPWKLD